MFSAAIAVVSAVSRQTACRIGSLGPAVAKRHLTTTTQTVDLKAALAAAIPAEQARLKHIKATYESKSLGEVTVDQALGGMRSIPGMLWEVSLLDPEETKLPAAKEGGQPLPEGLLWLLLTGQIPNKEQVRWVTEELQRRAELPAYVKRVLESMPRETHPMTRLTVGILALQPHSQFFKAYQSGLPKAKYWEPAY